MPTTISQNIQAVRDTVSIQPDGTLGRQVRDQSIEAMFEGFPEGDPAGTRWEAYMRNFSSSPEQLTRLCGKDDDFMAGPWATLILAYILAGGPCGGGTGMSITVNMPQPLKNILDAGVDNDPSPDGNPVLPDAVIPFLPTT